MATIPSTSDIKLFYVDFGQPLRVFYTPRELLSLGIYGGVVFYREEWKKEVGPEILKDVTWLLGSSMFNQSFAETSVNYFKVLGPYTQSQTTAKWGVWNGKNNPGWWFRNYCRLFYDSPNMEEYKKVFIIRMQIDNLRFLRNVLLQRPYTIPPENPEYTRFTDPNFAKDIKQSMLELGWDPTRDPADYGF